jgi:hypothetical protein
VGGSVDVGFLPDSILDQPTSPAQIGAVRSEASISPSPARAALAAVLALAVSPEGYTVADQAARVRALEQTSTATPPGKPPTICASCAANSSSSNPARPRRYQVPGGAARTIAAQLTLREHVIAPIRAGMRTLFTDLAINTAAQTQCRSRLARP